MKIDKIIAFCLLMFSVVPSAMAEGLTQTTVHIKGVILGPTCNIVNPELHVDFGNIVNKDLYYRKRTASIPFSIELEKCDLTLDHDAVVTFIGNESNALDLQGYLAVDDSSTASGIAIGIENANGKFIPLREESIKGPINSESIQLHFKAFVAAEDQAIKNNSIGLGAFTATATFYIEYE